MYFDPHVRGAKFNDLSAKLWEVVTPSVTDQACAQPSVQRVLQQVCTAHSQSCKVNTGRVCADKYSPRLSSCRLSSWCYITSVGSLIYIGTIACLTC